MGRALEPSPGGGLFARLKRHAYRRLDLDKYLPDTSTSAPRDGFCEWARALPPTATVLEVGTRQSVQGTPTHWHSLFPQIRRENYVFADVQPGTDVDVIADLHRLPADWTNRFDAVIAKAVFEHLERPWIAAREIERVLKLGGRCYVATHQTYPLHGYPSDFFRFSREALTLLFADAGLGDISAGYEHRTWIRLPKQLVPRSYAKGYYVFTWNRLQPSYLVVHLSARKASQG